MARRKKSRRKKKWKITNGEIRFFLIAAFTALGMWFVVDFLRAIILNRWDNPYILLVIGIFILLVVALITTATAKTK